MRWYAHALIALALIACDDEADSTLRDAVVITMDVGGRLRLDVGGPTSTDAAPAADAPVIVEEDSAVIEPDAAVLEPDAAVIEPDTSVIEPDTSVIEDAAIIEPDTSVVEDAAIVEPWPRRRCEIEITYEGGGDEVAIAGEFSGWTPLPMRREAGRFTITLDEDDGLSAGELYAYKLVVDGAWILDPAGTHREYHDRCVNSAFRFPECGHPLIEVDPITPQLDGEQASANVNLRILEGAGGEAITSVTAALDGAPLQLDSAAPGAYSVALSGLGLGRHVLSVRAAHAGGAEAAPVDAVFWVERAPFDWRSGPLYLLFIDRFANGERDSDGALGAPVPYGADWHGGDLWGALRVLESGYFESLGVRSIWLSPVNRQVEGHFSERDPNADPNHQISAYHGYWPIRAREVDARYGGDEALRAFVDAAHARGIRVLLDLINNQIHEQHEYMEDHEDWFRRDCLCGIDPGCEWSERPLDCLFAEYLPDINWRHPGAEAQFIDDALFWIEEFGVDGFRVDAVKHVETTSVYNLRAALHQRFEQGGARVVMLGETAVTAGDRFDDQCGEVYNSGYEWVSAYTGETALDGQFDFPTHHRMQAGVLNGEMSFEELEPILADMEAAYRPESLHVQFLGSHDASRMATRASSPPNGSCRFDDLPGCAQMPTVPEDPVIFARLKRAAALLMTMPGLPLLYYGDEIGLAGGNDPDSRRDMVWLEGLAELDMSGAGLSPQQADLRAWYEALGALRNAHPALSSGARRELWIEGDFYVFARWTDADAVVVAFSRSGEWIERQVSLGPIGRALPSLSVRMGEGEVRVEGEVMSLRIGPQAAVIMTP